MLPSKFGHISLLHVFFGEALPDAQVGPLWSDHSSPKGSLHGPTPAVAGGAHAWFSTAL